MGIVVRSHCRGPKTLIRLFTSVHFSPLSHSHPHPHPHKSELSLLSSPPSPSPHSFNTHFTSHTLSPNPPFPAPVDPASPEDVNDICRVLSDFRSPHHDIASALSPFSPKISPNLVEQVLKRCKNLGFSAHRFFIWAQGIQGFRSNPSAQSYYILIDVLGSSKQFPLIWDFLAEIRETGCCEIGPQFFWLIFRAYCKANFPADAVRSFSRMVEFGIQPGIDDLDKLLYVLCKRNHVRHAQQFFDRVKSDFEPSAKTYGILIGGWANTGDSYNARKLYDEMLERGVPIDVLICNSLVRCLCNEERMEEAFQLFQDMRTRGLEPNACSYSVFIRAYCEANDMHSAFRVLDRMKRYDLVPNVYTYNCIIKALCKSDRVDEAYQLLDEMVERGVRPDVWGYNAILAFHCDRCEVNRALRMISRMRKENCALDRHTYNMLLKMLIRIGRFDRVVDVWEGMEEVGFYPSVSTYSVMIHGLCKKKGKLEDACKYFERMIDEGIPPYLSTVELLRTRLIRYGIPEHIEVLADKMERSTSCSIKEMSNTMRGNKIKSGAKHAAI